MADEWICPITTELPLVPVTAEDGQVYERFAIEKLIRLKGEALKSPMTNLPMGPRLSSSTQARNTIEKLVRSGMIDGDKAERWLERRSEEELVNKTLAAQLLEGGREAKLEVTLPAGVTAGQKLVVPFADDIFTFAVPPNCIGGQKIIIGIPAPRARRRTHPSMEFLSRRLSMRMPTL